MLGIRGVILQEYSSDHNGYYKSHEASCKGRTFTVLTLKVTCCMSKSSDFKSILENSFLTTMCPGASCPSEDPVFISCLKLVSSIYNFKEIIPLQLHPKNKVYSFRYL